MAPALSVAAPVRGPPDGEEEAPERPEHGDRQEEAAGDAEARDVLPRRRHIRVLFPDRAVP